MMTTLLDLPATTDEARSRRAELVARAADLVPLLDRNAGKTEADRRVVEENVTALDGADLYRLLQPARFGGLETDMRTLVEVTGELARGCGATAWTVALHNIGGWFVGLFPDRCQGEVWAEQPRNRVAGVFAPNGQTRRVEGGYRISGKWGWASGCLHAQWGQLGIHVLDEAGNPVDIGFATIPMSELSIEDTWYVAGMRGTGSNTLVAEDVFVPDHRVISLTRALNGRHGSEHTDEALYRSAFVPAASLSLVGPHLGLARAALELVLEKAPKRAISYTCYQSQVDAPAVQFAVARAAMLIDSAHLHAYRAAADIDAAARAGGHPDLAARARVRADVGWAIQQAREAVRELVSAHGASAFAEVNPLQRILRDIETASRHAAVAPALCAEIYGRSLLGRTDGLTPFI
jgi:alkylation response protein AidB-like acyl-CoA dehydrogenase